MVHFIALYKMADGVDEAKIEELMRSSRSMLLRIPEVRQVRSGKRIESEMEFPFSVAIEFESMDKLSMFRDDPLWVKFRHDCLGPTTTESLELVYETEPGKNTKYS